MVRYRFVSAGDGDEYRRAIEDLFEGARVWATIPSSRATGGANGYVGGGRVTAPAVTVNDFEVEVDGATMILLRAPLEATDMGGEAHRIRVVWRVSRPS